MQMRGSKAARGCASMIQRAAVLVKKGAFDGHGIGCARRRTQPQAGECAIHR